MKNDLLSYDRQRYKNKKMPLFQCYYRKTQKSKGIIKKANNIFFNILKRFNHIEISSECKIGPGLYIGHPYCITINPEAIIGSNCNIHKGVTIGQENRGIRKGTPVIGNYVYFGINSTVVGKITIGDDVLIAPNCHVNQDVPSHSIVLGNPCVIKQRENATYGYIDNIITEEDQI